jgi:branched-chain amino acid transport system ATP-binding protein
MLAMGRALMSGPKVLLLDEPSLGLAPKMIALIAEIITSINAAGTAVLLVEQNAAMALTLADHVVVLEVGTVALTGSSADVANSPALAALYLGGHGEPASEAAGGTRAGAASPLAARTLSKWRG